MRATVPAETGDDCLQTGILFPVRRFTEISVGIIDGLLRNRKLLLELVCIQPHVTLNKCGNLRPVALRPLLSPHSLARGLLFLNFDLTRVVNCDFWQSSVACNFSGYADVLDAILGFDVSKFLAIAAPNHHRKDMVWVRLVEI